MKILKIFLSLVVVITACQITSCGKKSHTPVDEIVTLLEEGVKKTQNINNMAELSDVKNIVPQQEIWNLIRENSDYQLTKDDKEKLKKSYDKLIKAAYEKTSEYIPNEELKSAIKSQLDLTMSAVDKNIDNAETLGDIKGM